MSYTMNGLGVGFDISAGASIGPQGVSVTPPSVTLSASTPAPAPVAPSSSWLLNPILMAQNAAFNAQMQVLWKMLMQLQIDTAGYPIIQNRVDNLIQTWYATNRSTMTPSTKLFEANDLQKSIVSVQQALAVAKAAPKPAPKPAAPPPRPALPSLPVAPPPGLSTGAKVAIGAGVLGTLGAIWYALATASTAAAAVAIPNRSRRRGKRLVMAKTHYLVAKTLADRKRTFRRAIQQGESVSDALWISGLRYAPNRPR